MCMLGWSFGVAWCVVLWVLHMACMYRYFDSGDLSTYFFQYKKPVLNVYLEPFNFVVEMPTLCLFALLK